MVNKTHTNPGIYKAGSCVVPQGQQRKLTEVRSSGECQNSTGHWSKGRLLISCSTILSLFLEASHDDFIFWCILQARDSIINKAIDEVLKTANLVAKEP